MMKWQDRSREDKAAEAPEVFFAAERKNEGTGAEELEKTGSSESSKSLETPRSEETHRSETLPNINTKHVPRN